MKGMGALMVGWRDQMETASAHLAAVLGLVERDGKAVRYELPSHLFHCNSGPWHAMILFSRGRNAQAIVGALMTVVQATNRLHSLLCQS